MPQDKDLSRALALPNGAATTTEDDYWDLGHNRARLGAYRTELEFQLTVPALTVAELPNAETMRYTFESADDIAFTENLQTECVLITQTGASGAGAAAAVKRFHPASDCRRYLRYKITKTGTGNPSAKIATVDVGL
jgi:hypothetical protein